MNRKQRRKASKSKSGGATSPSQPNRLFTTAQAAPTVSVPGSSLAKGPTGAADVDFLVNVAKSHHQAGRLAQAEEIYLQILSKAPKHAGCLHLLGLVRHQQGRSREALELITKSLRNNPKDAEAHNNKGNVLRRLGYADEAIKSFGKAIKLAPGFAGAYSNLALTYRQTGNLSEAVKNYRMAIRKDPLSAESWHGLTSSGKLSLTDDEIGAAQQVLEAKTLSVSDRRHICFALGQHFDANQEWDQAFHYYSQANDLSEVTGKEGIIVGIFKTMEEEALDFLSNLSLPESEITLPVTPIFVVGMPRSGTTLVDQILVSHPDVVSGGETNLIDMEMRPVLAEAQASKKPLSECLTVDRLLRMQRNFSEAVMDIVERQGGEPTHFVDKSLLNLAYAPVLLKLFPEAKVVHCERNPLDTCVSIYFTDFKQTYDYTTNLSHIGEAYCCSLNLMERWRRMCDDSIHGLKYEDLLEHQEKETKRLLEFCNLPWNEDCLRFFETDRQVATPSDWQVRQPIFSTSRDRWKNYEGHLTDLIKALKECI